MARTDVVDILIIGSGAAAGPFAWHLSAVRGMKIVCLEQGDWVGKRAYKPDAEGDGQRQRLATPPQQGVRYFPNGYPYDYSQSDWQPILGNVVGGASVHYAAVWARLHPSDFVLRSITGMADDWPISYWDLAPYYDQIDTVVGVAGVPGNPAYPPKPVELQPPHKLNKNAEVLSRGFNRLEWHWWPSERAVLTRPFRGRGACLTNCATCDDGCPREAKNSSDVVFWPEAIKSGVVLKTRARVREITIDKRGLADGALYYDADGRLQEQRARLVVVACNGIGTPRLLLNSKSKLFPQGLANSSGLVGKNLMGHPSAGATALFENESADAPGAITNSLNSDQFYESDPSRSFAGGFSFLSTSYVGSTSAALGEPAFPAATIVPAALRSAGPSRNALPWGAPHHVALQERFDRNISASSLCQELPEEVNRVELHPTLTDEVGIPAVKLIYRRGRNTDKLMDFAIERAKEVLEAARATKIVGTSKHSVAHHVLGTARMGRDPKKSVVDKWGRAHDIKNLYIIDGSVFTTSGACTPTATIQAIALRTADYIKNHARE